MFRKAAFKQIPKSLIGLCVLGLYCLIMTLMTVGYEGTSIEEFVNFLKKSKVHHIVDVRKNPVSRKKGFSKKALAKKLNDVDIEYSHLPGLGVPTAWRKAAKEEKITRKKMFRDYVQKILPKQEEDFKVLTRLLKKKGLCLLCYEANALDCHRLFVANELEERKKRLEVEHLLFPQPEIKSITRR